MRTNEERINAMHARASELNKQRRARQVRIMQAAGAAVSFAATIVLAVCVPRLADFETEPAGSPLGQAGTSGIMNASIFSNSAALGYVVIALIAFLLGVTLTIFCFRLREWQKHKDEQET